MVMNGRGKRRPALSDPNAGQSAFGNRLKLLASHWPSAERLARAAGVSPSAFRKWIRGEAEPSRDRLIALSETAGVGLDWLIRGHGPDPSPRIRPNTDDSARPSVSPHRGGASAEDFLYLPNVPESAAAGTGDTDPGPARRFIGFREDWIRSVLETDVKSVELETAIGDSMEPGINDGDLLLIDTSDPRITAFGIYVLELRGERIVKRVQRRFDGTVMLISDNPRYLSEELSADLVAELKVIGKVVWRGGVI